MQTSTTAVLAFLLASATLRAQSSPANDDFANRQVLPPELAVSVAGTTNFATQEAFEAAYGGGLPYGEGIDEAETVWHDDTAPIAGLLSINHKPLPGTVSVPAGETSVALKVKPRAGTDNAAVKLTLQAGDGYAVGSDAGAKVKIVGGQ